MIINDNFYYHMTANLIVGRTRVRQIRWEYAIFLDTIQPSAAHPPGFTAYLSVWSFSRA